MPEGGQWRQLPGVAGNSPVTSTWETSVAESGSVALTAAGHNEPTGRAFLCRKTEQLAYQTDFARHAWMAHDAVTAADHAQNLETSDGGGGCLHPLEATRRTDHALERAVICLDDVIQVFRCPVLDILRQQPLAL
jgi:hypothetical protein